MGDFWIVIWLTFFGFTALAALLLIPVWKFLNREEKAAEVMDKAHLDSDAHSDSKNHVDSPVPSDL